MTVRAPAGPTLRRWTGEGVRLATAGTVVYFMALKVAAAGPMAWAAVCLLALVLLPPTSLVSRWTARRHPVALTCFGIRGWVQRRGFLARWSLRGLFCAAMAMLSLAPLHHAETLAEAKVLWDSPDMPAYDAILDPEGKVLYVSHAHARLVGGTNGVSRIDLESGQVKSRPHDDDHGHYLTLYPEANRLVVHSYREPSPGDDTAPAKGGHLYYLDPDELTLVAERSCRQGYPIRSYRVAGGEMLTVCKDDKILVHTTDLTAPCGPEARRLPVGSKEAGNQVRALEHLTFVPGAPHLAWATGEGGGYGCLMNITSGETEQCVWLGRFVWSTAIEPQTGDLWVARPAHHRVDIRDGKTGASLGHFAVHGVPRPLAFDPGHGLAFVGMYFSGNIAVVDTTTREVLAEVGAGARLRRLLVDQRRDRLIAVGAGQILSYPLKILRRLALEAKGTMNP